MPNCCTDLSDCGGLSYSSNCVLYAGEDITSLPISRGDSLTYIIGVFSDEINNLSNGKDILLPDVSVSGCKFISDSLGSQEKNLVNVLNAIITNQCSLKSDLEDIDVTPTYTFDKKCLAFSDSKLQTVIQAVINQACQNKTDISSLNTKVSKNTSDISTLKSQVTSILGDDDSDTPPAFTFSQLMPPYVPMPYIGDLSNFDSTGKGKSANGYGNIYIMNGKNGTQDWRGYIPMGANSGVPGGTVDARVNPTNNQGFAVTPGQKNGEIYHTISINEMPSHSHGVIDPGHSHTYTEISDASHPKGGSTKAARHYSASQTSISKTGISLSSTGGGQGHNNMPPIVGTVWIVKIP